MKIGGGKLIEISLNKGEKLLLQNKNDIEEVSSYLSTLNPLNLYKLGSMFYLGQLFLTSQRITLLPYSKIEVDKAKKFEKIAYSLLGKLKLNIPKPEMLFFNQPLIIPLSGIILVNPFRKQAGIHSALTVFTRAEKYLFKYVNSPQEWASLIVDYSEAEIKDVVLRKCVSCGKMGVTERSSVCTVCGQSQVPDVNDMLTGKITNDFIGHVLKPRGWKQKLRALTTPQGQSLECPSCHFLNHYKAVCCKYCRANL